MPKITKERKGEYLKECLRVLSEKGGECPSALLIKEMGNRLNLSDHEKGLNNSGQYNWITHFRFSSIGLVKAGLIQKKKGLWLLKDKEYNFESLTPLEIKNLSDGAYDNWKTDKIDENDDYEFEENEDPEILMDVKPDDIRFQELISGIDSSKIQVPPFQRSFVWRPADIRYLLDSIYRGYPIGSFIFWKTTRKLPHTRSIGNINFEQREVAPGAEISYVLDGQQRITSLFAAVKGADIDGERFRFLFDIRSKKFLVSKVGSSNIDDLIEADKKNLQISIESVITNTLAAYRQLCRQYGENDDYANTLNTLFERFTNYRFSVINVIDQNTNNEEEQSEGVKQVVRMFSRINDTGRKLTVVAKMVAKCWGEDFDLRESLDNFYNENNKLSSIREETILQVASVILNYKKCRSRDILDRTNIRKLEEEWDNINKSFLFAVEFIKTKLHIKNFNYLPFDSILVPLSYLFYKQSELNNEQTKIVEKWFWLACLSNRYDSTVESKIEEDCSYFDKILNNEVPVFSYFIDWETLKSRIISQRYNLRNAFVKTILALYSYSEPKNLVDGRDVSLDDVFSGYYKHNLHHIFPQAYLRRAEANKKELFDSVANIMFIPAITNISISDEDPASYLKEIQKNNSDLKEILVKHFIPNIDDSGLLENNFINFLSYRADQIVRMFRVKTGVGMPAEEYFDTNPAKPVDIIESRVRGLIQDILKEQTDDSYWNEYIPSDIRESVERKIQDDLKRHPYRLEEYMRDEVRITFLDVMDYSKIILSNWQLFDKYFGSKGEVEQHFRALKNYRNPIKHGRDLNEIDKRNGEAAVMWLENILNNLVKY